MRSETLALAPGSDPGEFGAFEQVQLAVLRVRGPDMYENPVGLTLELKLTR